MSIRPQRTVEKSRQRVAHGLLEDDLAGAACRARHLSVWEMANRTGFVDGLLRTLADLSVPDDIRMKLDACACEVKA
jgi:hypothetical protein